MSVAQIHVDLETLGVRHTSQILSIGAVHGANTFYREIDAYQYNPNEFTEDASTLEWWVKQGGFIPTQDLVSPMQAVSSFAQWVLAIREQHNDIEVWANSPTFDCAILRHHFKIFSLSCPWEFWSERDVRTVKGVAKALNMNITAPKNPHNALKDAKNQQAMVASFYETVADYITTIRELRLQGKLNEQEICMELHSPDGV